MNRMPERALNLLGRDRIRLGGAVQEHAHALAAGPELAHALEQALRVANRRHVRVRDEKDRVGGVQRRDRARIDLAAGVDDDVLVLPREQPEQLFDRAAVGGAGPVELIGAREDLETGLVLDDQLFQELAVEPVQVVGLVDKNAGPAPVNSFARAIRVVQ